MSPRITGSSGLLAQDGLGEVRHLAKADAHARQFLLGPREQALDLLGVGRAVVVAGHPHAEPGLVGPVRRRAQFGAVGSRAHRQHPRPVGAFPPVQQRERRGANNPRCSPMWKNFTPACARIVAVTPSVRSHIGHLGGCWQRLSGQPGHLDRISEARGSGPPGPAIRCGW